MSKPIKIAVLLAALFGGVVVAYHLIQSSGSDESVSAVSLASKNTKPSKSHSAASDDDRTGLGDLMSRIRNHIDTVDQTPDKPQPPVTPIATPAPAPVEQPQKQDNPADPPVAVSPPLVTHTTVVAAPRIVVKPSREDNAETPPRTRTMITNTAPPPDTRTPSDNPNGVVLAGDTVSNTRAIREDLAGKITAKRRGPVRHPRIKIRGEFPKTYAIQPGDTFTTIAVKLYGAEVYWLDIAIANPFVDPKRLQIGQTIRLPAPEDILEPASEGSPPVNQNSQVMHHVRSDDSLSSIAKRYYDDTSLWRVIYDQNRDLIGPNPNRLTVGQMLDIPPQFIPAQ